MEQKVSNCEPNMKPELDNVSNQVVSNLRKHSGLAKEYAEAGNVSSFESEKSNIYEITNSNNLPDEYYGHLLFCLEITAHENRVNNHLEGVLNPLANSGELVKFVEEKQLADSYIFEEYQAKKRTGEYSSNALKTSLKDRSQQVENLFDRAFDVAIVKNPAVTANVQRIYNLQKTFFNNVVPTEELSVEFANEQFSSLLNSALEVGLSESLPSLVESGDVAKTESVAATMMYLSKKVSELDPERVLEVQNEKVMLEEYLLDISKK